MNRNKKISFKIYLCILILILSLLSVGQSQTVSSPISISDTTTTFLNTKPSVQTPFDLRNHKIILETSGTCLCSEDITKNKHWNVSSSNTFYCTRVTPNQKPYRIYFDVWFRKYFLKKNI